MKRSDISGIVLLHKEEGMSSQYAVNRVKRIFGVDKAGHTGTLDPLATGVLPVLVGRAVKASEFMLTSDKHYSATLLLGVKTDTDDITGTVLSEVDEMPTEEEVISAAKSFIGKSKQVPPMYSAIKVGGEKLYELARRGETVEREARDIVIHSLEIERINEREYKIDVHCSKGTYIRSLLADIGERLGVGGTMKTLERTEASGFPLSMTHTIGEFEEMSEEERLGAILPVERVFEKFEAIRLSAFFARLAHAGQEIYLKKIGKELALGALVRLIDAEGFFAVGEVKEFDDGAAIKLIRQFGKL